MLMRYIGPLDEAQIAIAGNDFGMIKRGESLVVPDDLAKSVGWSEHWENVKETKKARKQAKEPVSGDLTSNDSDVNEPGTVDESVSDSNTENPDIDENIATDNSENEEGK